MSEHPIVFDNGTSVSKVGFAGDEQPLDFPTIVGKQKSPTLIIGEGSARLMDTFVGNGVWKKGVFTYKYPIERGLVTDWELMETVWDHTFKYELRVEPEDKEILILETPLNPKKNREMMTKIMFEQFSVSSLYAANQSIMSLLSTDRTTGLVLDSGGGITSSVPVYEGFALPHASLKLELGGEDLTDSLKKMLVERGYIFNTIFEIQVVNDMKEKLCYVAMNFEEESKKDSLETDYELPDGNVITIGSERFRATELLFNPSLIGLEVGGIHELISTSIRKCDVDIRMELYSNIVLSGGSTLFNGIAQRLNNELNVLSHLWNIHAVPPKRNNMAWIGGSIFASMSTFKQKCLKKEEYDENGPNIVHRIGDY